MGKSHQAGWVLLRGRRWYGYFRRRVLDPITNEEGARVVCLPLGLKSQMSKSEARELLRAELIKKTGHEVAGGRILKDSSTTFGWFVRNRYFPLREGDWRPESAKVKKIQIERDLLARFEDYPLDSIDRFMLQTHLNGLAKRLSQDRVKQARSYAKSIFDEAIEQEFLEKDPTRKLKTPRSLRSKDKQVLTWDQLRLALSRTSRRDRLLLMMDMTEALRPSELFALRWRSFNNIDALTITETVYRGNVRPFGKTDGSLTDVHLPSGLAAELRLWKEESTKVSKKGFVSPDDFIFPNGRGGCMDTGNYRSRVLKPLAEEMDLPKLNFQIMRRTMATQAQGMGSVKDIQAHLRHAKADTTANEYMQELPESVKRMVGSVYTMLTKGGEGEGSSTDLLPNATNPVAADAVSD